MRTLSDPAEQINFNVEGQLREVFNKSISVQYEFIGSKINSATYH